ncbi:MAG: hypothetical protein EZS28_015734, partial [Streblomastix strix]
NSVGIMVSIYINTFVVCASGGVRSIADIQSTSYSKSEDDALLLLKADKSTTYSKTEDDALLLLKADKSSTYTKTETDTLLDAKANVVDIVDSYSKTEDDALLLLKADKTDTYTKTETDTLLDGKADKTELIDSYSKTEDDALILLKADKTQLIDSYSKGETNNLLNNKTDYAVTYTKGEDDALFLLKADKTQLIDSYIKGETNNLLNDKADTAVSYTKGEDDAFLLLKADKSTTYFKTEDDVLLLLKADKTQLIDSYIKGEDDALLLLKADKSTTYSKTEDDALILLKADKTQLIDSYTKGETNNLLHNKANLSTTYTKPETDQLIQQIDVRDVDLTDYYNKTKPDELLGEKTDTTELSNYVTLGADNTFVLLGAGGTKPLSEFTGTPTDLSNYYTKTQTFSQTEANNKFVRLEGSIQQTTTGRLKYVSPFDYQDETQDPVASTYLTQSEVDAKLTNVVTTNTTQSITGSKTFTSNVSATGFMKTSKDDTSILLARGGDRLLSSFGGIEDLTSSAFSRNYSMGTFNADYLVQDDIAVITYIPYPNSTVDKGGYVSITHSTGLISCKSTSNTYIYIMCICQLGQMNVYLDEALLEAAGLLEFPEYYAHILERYQEPVLPAQAIPIVEQTLQKQVKGNDDILFSTNEEFVPPVSNAAIKLDLSSQLERSSSLTSSGSDPQLIMCGDRVTLTVSYETTGLFPGGYLFKSQPEFARPKEGNKVIALVGTNTTNKNSIFCYIDQNGPFIISAQQIPSTTGLFVNRGHAYNTYYIVDDWTCKVCVFNLYFKAKGQLTSTQEIGLIPDAVLPTDGKSMGFLASVYRNAGGYINWLAGIFNQLKKLIQVVDKGISWMNDKVDKPIMPITKALLQSLEPAGGMVAKGISVGSSAVDALFGPNKQQSKQQFRQDFKTFQQDDFLWKNVPIDIISNRIKLIGDELQ